MPGVGKDHKFARKSVRESGYYAKNQMVNSRELKYGWHDEQLRYDEPLF